MMQKYRAALLFPEGAGEQRYEFEAPDTFFHTSPSRIIDTFLGTINNMNLPGNPVDNEINGAHNYRDIKTVTGGGSIILETGQTIPFVIMISPART